MARLNGRATSPHTLQLSVLTVSCNEPGFDAAALTHKEREFGIGLLELTV